MILEHRISNTLGQTLPLCQASNRPTQQLPVMGGQRGGAYVGLSKPSFRAGCPDEGATDARCEMNLIPDDHVVRKIPVHDGVRPRRTLQNS